tara:strand:+ start:58 stop:1152 length:1095 start_codon:yes stop_codon:yes gene_type:complete
MSTPPLSSQILRYFHDHGNINIKEPTGDGGEITVTYPLLRSETGPKLVYCSPPIDAKTFAATTAWLAIDGDDLIDTLNPLFTKNQILSELKAKEGTALPLVLVTTEKEPQVTPDATVGESFARHFNVFHFDTLNELVVHCIETSFAEKLKDSGAYYRSIPLQFRTSEEFGAPLAEVLMNTGAGNYALLPQKYKAIPSIVKKAIDNDANWKKIPAEAWETEELVDLIANKVRSDNYDKLPRALKNGDRQVEFAYRAVEAFLRKSPTPDPAATRQWYIRNISHRIRRNLYFQTLINFLPGSDALPQLPRAAQRRPQSLLVTAARKVSPEDYSLINKESKKRIATQLTGEARQRRKYTTPFADMCTK